MTIITLGAVRKRSFVLPVHYESSGFNADVGDIRTTRAGSTRTTRGGNIRTVHDYETLGSRQILQARKRSFTKSVVVIDD